MTIDDYLFKSDRLGFRNWRTKDYKPMAEISTDPKVMEFFPSRPSEKQTIEFIEKMQHQFVEKGYCYFAVDKLDNNEFIGFIGLSDQIFDADFTPCIDIGWRLKASEWNKGLATEGARKCLQYAFEHLAIKKIYAIAPTINLKSEKVMKKIGMKKAKIFSHPKLLGDQKLQECVLYEIRNFYEQAL